jgi:hypothetical protein
MQPPQVEYRRVRLPRTDMFFSACWFDENESLDIFAHFDSLETAEKLSKMLKSIGYEPSVHKQNWKLPATASEPVEYYELLIYLIAPRFTKQIWTSGEVISEEEAGKRYKAIEELIR